MGFIYIPGPFIEVDPSALKKNGTNTPTADIDWGGFDLNNVLKLSIGSTAASTHSFLWLENSTLNEHPNIDVVSVQADRQPGVRFRVTDLTTPGFAIGGIRGFWGANQVARVDLVRSDDVDPAGPGGNKNEGYISFSVKNDASLRSAVIKIDETGSLEFQNAAGYATNLKWLGSGQILAPDGTFSGPSISFANDPDLGFYRVSANKMGFITNGQQRMTLDADTLSVNSNLTVQNAWKVTLSTLAAEKVLVLNSAKEIIASSATAANLVTLTDGSNADLLHEHSTVAALNDLSDVNAGTPNDGDNLTWDNGTSKWIAAAASGSGDVSGPASSTDEAIARFDSTTGKLLQNSTVTMSDAGTITMPSAANIVFPHTSGGIEFSSATPSKINTNGNTLRFFAAQANPQLSIPQYGAIISTVDINPATTGTSDLGGDTIRWRNAYLRNAYIGGSNVPANLNIESGAAWQDGYINFLKDAGANASLGFIRGLWNNNHVANIQMTSGVDATNKDDGQIVFSTSESGGSPSERLRINQVGQVSVNAAAPDASALVQIDSSTQGFLPPRNTDPATNITSPATGLVVYNTTTNKLQVYTGSGWETITSS